MKIRTAKKIMLFNPNARLNRHMLSRFSQLRPPRYAREDRLVYPSFHDIDIIRRARCRLFRWIRRYENKKKKKPKCHE